MHTKLPQRRNPIVSRFIISALLIVLFFVPFGVSHAATSYNQPSSIQAPAASTCVDFSSLAPGASVEGLGAINPVLSISTSSGNAVSIVSGTNPSAYGAPNDTLVQNNGIGDLAGFFDTSRIHDYVFTFAPDTTVKYFSVTMLDFGDFNSIGATEHNVSLVALNADNEIVATDSLFFTSDGQTITWATWTIYFRHF